MLSPAHLTHSIIMVQPIDFGYNEQTGQDNAFQHKPSGDESHQITQTALQEFADMVALLQSHQVEVITLGKTHTQQKLPDAVFPNNWFSTRADGSLIIYPMKTPNRQAEVQVEQLTAALNKNNYQVTQVVDLRLQQPAEILEGTGSLIFHHPTRQVFAAISERCQSTALAQYCLDYRYTERSFNSQSQSGQPIYHTNVLMSCGQNFAVIADQVLADARQKQLTLTALAETVEDVILITEQQMSDNFCGNILQIENANGKPLIVMSHSAYQGFLPAQLNQLEKHGELVICKIPTIEHIGGGSARCMIAENFLPKE